MKKLLLLSTIFTVGFYEQVMPINKTRREKHSMAIINATAQSDDIIESMQKYLHGENEVVQRAAQRAIEAAKELICITGYAISKYNIKRVARELQEASRIAQEAKNEADRIAQCSEDSPKQYSVR